MINRISEIPFWGPEEQIRRFINQYDSPDDYWEATFANLAKDGYYPDPSTEGKSNQFRYDTLVQSMAISRVNATLPASQRYPVNGTEQQKADWLELHKVEMNVQKNDIDVTYRISQQTITQQRIENLDEIYQKQLIWSYGLKNVDDAYFYQDWCPIGDPALQEEPYIKNPKWQMDLWGEAVENIKRDMDRSFKFDDFKGYTKSEMRRDEMVQRYDASEDLHTKASNIESGNDDDTDLDVDTLRHNIMWSYLEVSEWLGDGATSYGSQNGFVSRKMSLAWLFNAIKALINWKLANQDKWAEEDIHPLMIDDGYEVVSKDELVSTETYYKYENGNYVAFASVDAARRYSGNVYIKVVGVKERFLREGEVSTRGVPYKDELSLDQSSGYCATLTMVRAADPENHGTLKVRGNEWHYGERAYFYTHNAFIGECRFFHNARFLGQATFDKEINGTAMRSRWADLAEYKEADEQYEPGTLVMFGGEKEVTLSRYGVANAVVTTKPGLVLNGDESSTNCTMVGIVLTGTTPVKISRAVKKFDKLVADEQFPGYARPRKWWEFWKKPIAIALDSWPAGGKVNCITKMEF